MVSTTMLVFGRRLAQARDRRQARAARHVDVEHQDARAVGRDPALGHLDVTGFGDDLEPILGVEQEAQAGPDDLVIVGDDDRDRIRRLLDVECATRVAHHRDSSTVPGSIRVGPDSCRLTAPRTMTSAPKVTSPSTTRRSASRSDGGPSGKRRSNSSMSL